MINDDIYTLLESHGIKPTANRILVAKALAEETYPMSMKELEQTIVTLDKSSVFRVLTLFRDHHLVHDVEDGEGNVRYELCMHNSAEGFDDDVHAHFYCEQCHRVFCLEQTAVPEVEVPEGFTARSVNYLIKGLCPDCRRKRH